MKYYRVKIKIVSIGNQVNVFGQIFECEIKACKPRNIHAVSDRGTHIYYNWFPTKQIAIEYMDGMRTPRHVDSKAPKINSSSKRR